MSAPGNLISTSPAQLAQWLAEGKRVVVLDVRKQPAFDKNPMFIPGAVRVPPETLSEWARSNPASSPVLTYCVHGHEVSQGAAALLQGMGYQLSYLEGGLSEWQAQGHSVRSGSA